MAVRSGPARWWERDTTPGYLLVAAALVSFVLQNGPTEAAFAAFLKAPVGLTLGAYTIESYVRGMVKDALMAVFFLYAGLELKREVLEGPLRSVRSAALPVIGALGGMAAPALIYVAVATHLMPGASPDYLRGWAIPSATDIAFAVGVLALLGARVPSGLRLFLLAVAIVDDLGAILVIALFYTSSVSVPALGASGLIFAGMLAMNRFGVRALTPYWVATLFLWGAMYQTGVSPTLAGVLAAFAIPMRRPDGRSPLVEAEHALKPWVQLGIMPVFALIMAGVPLSGVTLESVLHPVALGIAAGLTIGKPLGIALATWIGVKALRQQPPGNLLELIGVGWVAGIGFTMSLFIGALAFYDDEILQTEVRIGVLGGSLISATLGLLFLAWALSVSKRHDPNRSLAEAEDLAEERGLIEDIDEPERR